MKIPDYVKLQEIEKQIKIKSAELKNLKERQHVRSANEEVRLKAVQDNYEAWLKFRSFCIKFAEDCLKLKEREKVLDSRYLEVRRLDDEIKSLESQDICNRLVKPPSPSVSGVNSKAIIKPTEPIYVVQESADCVFSIPERVTASGNVKSIKDADHAIMVDTQTKSVAGPFRSDSLVSLPDFDNSTFVPPTPRTNLRQLKLGTSLLTAKKKMQSSEFVSSQQSMPKIMPSSESL